MSRSQFSRALLVALSLVVCGCGGGGGGAPAVANPGAAPTNPGTGGGPNAPGNSGTPNEESLLTDARAAGYEAGLAHGKALYEAEQDEDAEAPEAPMNPYEEDCQAAIDSDGAPVEGEDEVDTESEPASEETSDEADPDAEEAAEEDPDEEEDEGEGEEADSEPASETTSDTPQADDELCGRLAEAWQEEFDKGVKDGRKIAKDGAVGEEGEDSDADGAPLTDDPDGDGDPDGEDPEDGEGDDACGAGKDTIYQVDSIQYTKRNENGVETLVITVRGQMNTGGYGEAEASQDTEASDLDGSGLLALKICLAEPSGDMVTQGFVDVEAEFTMTGDDIGKVQTIQVDGQQGSKTAAVDLDGE